MYFGGGKEPFPAEALEDISLSLSLKYRENATVPAIQETTAPSTPSTIPTICGVLSVDVDVDVDVAVGKLVVVGVYVATACVDEMMDP